MIVPRGKVPRGKMSVALSAGKAVALGLGSAAAVQLAYYVTRVRRAPEIHAPSTPLTQHVLRRCRSLREPYSPPVWCFHTLLQLAYCLAFQKALQRRHLAGLPLRREVLRMADGGEVALDWAQRPHAPALPPDAPILVYLHGITGNAMGGAGYFTQAADLNWRCVALVRRGHLEAPLTSPRFNIVGNSKDCKVMLDEIRARFPDAPIMAVGESAGTGVLVRYLGENQEQSVVGAAVAVSPGYGTGPGGAFTRLAPWLSKYLLRGVQEYFLRPNEAVLGGRPGYAEAMAAADFGELQRHVHHLEGFASQEEYYEGTDPLRVAGKVVTPALILNARDDPVCVESNVTDNLHLFAGPGHERMLALTSHGSHVCYYEGLLGPKGITWAERVAVEYLREVLEHRVRPAMQALRTSNVELDVVVSDPKEL